MLRIANASGFYGDRFSALREQVEGGPIDVLTGDYLAELTMVILRRQQARDASAGYCKTFVRQIEPLLKTILARGIKVVVNAGGVNPHACARAVAACAAEQGLQLKIAVVDGDDVLARVQAGEFAEEPHIEGAGVVRDLKQPIICANVYLGARGIAAALAGGADMVITGRVVDSALVLGPAAWRYNWNWRDWDRLAAGIVAGHLLECGPQVSGGNYCFADEVPSYDNVGFPICEIEEDGRFVVTKHPKTGGAVRRGTVIAQALYEIGEPAYATPDVTARFDSFAVREAGSDRVLVEGVKGEPPPSTLKLSLHYAAGFRNSLEIALGPGAAQQKLDAVRDQLWRAVGGREQFSEIDEQVFNDVNGTQLLRVAVRAADEATAGRRFSSAAVELALSSVAGITFGAPPDQARPCVTTWPVAIPRAAVRTRITHHDDQVQELSFE